MTPFPVPPSRAGLAAALLLTPLFPSCMPQEAQISSLKEQISAARDANQEASTQLSQLSQKISSLAAEVRTQETLRREFEEKSKQSAETERIVVKYRTSLEEDLAKYTESVAAYRRKNLAP